MFLLRLCFSSLMSCSFKGWRLHWLKLHVYFTNCHDWNAPASLQFSVFSCRLTINLCFLLTAFSLDTCRIMIAMLDVSFVYLSGSTERETCWYCSLCLQTHTYGDQLLSRLNQTVTRGTSLARWASTSSRSCSRLWTAGSRTSWCLTRTGVGLLNRMRWTRLWTPWVSLRAPQHTESVPCLTDTSNQTCLWSASWASIHGPYIPVVPLWGKWCVQWCQNLKFSLVQSGLDEHLWSHLKDLMSTWYSCLVKPPQMFDIWQRFWIRAMFVLDSCDLFSMSYNPILCILTLMPPLKE